MISGGYQLQWVTDDPCRLHSFASGRMAEEVEIVFQMLKAIQHMGTVTYVQCDSDTGETTIEAPRIRGTTYLAVVTRPILM